MIIDQEGHNINIRHVLNEHVKVIGTTGSGKTFWACQEIKKLSSDRAVLIVDFSSSYTDEELSKHGISTGVNQIDLTRERLTFAMNHNIGGDLTDALTNVFDIFSYKQMKLVEEVVKNVLCRNGVFTLRSMFEELTKNYDESIDDEEKKVLDKLLQRFYPVRDFATLQVVEGKQKAAANSVYIIQLSGLGENIMGVVANFVLELLCHRIWRGSNTEVTIIVDECQKIKLCHTAVEKMIREGRKRNLGLILMTQYFPNEPEVMELLKNVDCSLYFHPGANGNKQLAKVISGENPREWWRILKNLRRGECILCGNYSIDGKKHVCNSPIICKVQ